MGRLRGLIRVASRRGGIRAVAAVVGAGGLLGAGACLAPVVNLPHPATPRFEGRYAPPPPGARPAALRVVTFNVKLARRIDRAIAVLGGSDSLRGADVIALQEMDETAVDRIARALRLNYVYYPAVIHPTDRKYFGPAVLSRWPIEESAKLILPHEDPVRRQRRTATVAVIRVADLRIRVYAVHLDPLLRVSDADRADQVAAILADAERSADPVVLAGDFNSYAVGRVAERRGYLWATKTVTNTIWFFSWDHIFARGLAPATPPSAGTAASGGASDHRPVWAVLALPPPGTARAYQSRSPERPPPARRPRWVASCSRCTASSSRRAAEGLSSSTDSPSPEPNPPPAIAPTAASGFPS